MGHVLQNSSMPSKLMNKLGLWVPVQGCEGCGDDEVSVTLACSRSFCTSHAIGFLVDVGLVNDLCTASVIGVSWEWKRKSKSCTSSGIDSGVFFFGVERKIVQESFMDRHEIRSILFGSCTVF